jgi:hypothetical protein
LLEWKGLGFSVDIPSPVWGTALAMAYMKYKLTGLQDDWQLMYKKAQVALDKNVQAAASLNKLISGSALEQKAAEVLKNM